MNLDII